MKQIPFGKAVAITLAVIIGASVFVALQARAATTVCNIFNGCTGTSTGPTYGQVLVGGKNGEYEYAATSTFGGAGGGGGGAVNSVFGRIGVVTAQSGDYTTSLVSEGSNLYYTAARSLADFIANLAATTSVASITTLSHLSLPYSQLTGIPVIASSTLLGDSNTFSGANTFSTLPKLGSLTGNLQINNGTLYTTATSSGTCSGGASCSAFTVLGSVAPNITVSGLTTGNFTSANVSQFTNDASYLTPTTFNTSFDNRITATTSLPSITTLAGLSLPYSQLTGTPKIASTTLLGDTNTFSGTDKFSNAITDAALNGLIAGNSGLTYASGTTTATCTGNASCPAFTILGTTPVAINVAAGTAASSTLLGDTNTFSGTDAFSNTIKVASLSGVVGANSGTLYAVSSSSLFGYTPLNPTRQILTTWPIQGGGDLSADRTLTFGGLTTSTPAVQGNLAYFSGVNTFANVATTSVTCTGNASCTAFTAIGTSPISINVAAGTAASTTLLGDTNTFSGSDKFNNAITDAALNGLIAGNSGLTYAVSTTSMNASITGSAGSVANALTFNNSGTGASSGQTFNGSGAVTISYNTIGAQVAGNYATFGYDWAPFTNYGINTNSTTTALSLRAGVFASSTSNFDQINIGSTTSGTMATSTDFGSLVVKGNSSTTNQTISNMLTLGSTTPIAGFGGGLSISGNILSNSGVLSLTNGTGIACSGNPVGSCSFANQSANTVLTNQSSGNGVPTGEATSTFGNTLYGTGTGGQVLTWNNGAPQWVATTTYNSPLSFANGAVSLTTSGTWSGNAGTATALAANGTNCSAGSYALGVDASGNSEGCTVAAVGTVTSVTGTFPIASSGGATPSITFGGLSTSSAIAAGAAVLYATGVNTMASVATTSATCGSGLTCTGFNVLGSNNPSFALATINAGVLGAVTNGSVPTSQATTTLYGALGAPGTVLMSSNGSAVWFATSSSGSSGVFSFTPNAAGFFNQAANSTSTQIHFAAAGVSLSASSTAWFDQVNIGSSTVSTMATSTDNGNFIIKGNASTSVLSVGGANPITSFRQLDHKIYVCASTVAFVAGCDYVATGANDQVQIQAGYEAAAALGGNLGGELWLSEGLFHISATTTLDKNNVHIHGAGAESTTIQADNNTNVSAFACDPTQPLIFNSLEGMTLYGNNLQNTTYGYGFYCTGTPGIANHFWDFTVRDVWEKNWHNDGFYSYDGHGFVLDHNLAEYNVGNGVTFAVNGTDEVEVQNGTYKFNQGNGLALYGNGDIAYGNEVSDNTLNGIEVGGVSGSITNNVIYSNLEAGIHVISQPHINVTFNAVKTNRQQGIFVETSDTNVIGNELIGNSTTTPTFDEIDIEHHRANVQFNNIDGQSKSRFGINFGAGFATGDTAMNNVCTGEVSAGINDASSGSIIMNSCSATSSMLFNTQKFTLTTGGFLGIGTTTPWGTLSVTGTSGQTSPLFMLATSTGGSGVFGVNFNGAPMLSVQNSVNLNRCVGTTTLSSGTATISTQCIAAGDNVSFSIYGQTASILGSAAYSVKTITAGTSFVASSTLSTDNRTLWWEIKKPIYR
jgi:hypothetical protein